MGPNWSSDSKDQVCTMVWEAERKQKSAWFKENFQFLACLFEWMLLIKEMCNRFVKENDKVLWYLFSWIANFLRLRSQHFAIGLSIHLFICLSSICWVYTVCQKCCVNNMWECVFVVLYLFILIIAYSICPVIFVEWIVGEVPWRLCIP